MDRTINCIIINPLDNSIAKRKIIPRGGAVVGGGNVVSGMFEKIAIEKCRQHVRFCNNPGFHIIAPIA